MIKSSEIVRSVTQRVVDKSVSRVTAAKLLGTTVRTISNYTRRYIMYGAWGLIDRRHGNYRKLTAETEQRIVECKMMNFHRSVRWIRNRLNLDVTVESVRRVLVKHNLNGRTCGIGSCRAIINQYALQDECGGERQNCGKRLS